MRSRSLPKLVVAIVGACAIASVLDGDQRLPSSVFESSSSSSSSAATATTETESGHLRRLQLSEEGEANNNGDYYGGAEEASSTGSVGADDDVDAVYPWARDHLHPLTVAPSTDNPSDENYLFWHIPKSGGSTIKALYRCFRKNLSVIPNPGAIVEARDEGLIDSGEVDLFVTTYPAMAAREVLSVDHKGRAMAVFRHPVERLISKFYYLQVADWENSYRPDWKEMDVLTWAQIGNSENDFMVKMLAGKTQRDLATEADLHAAMDTLHSNFVVGLLDEMRESVRRFNVVMGLSEEGSVEGRCLERFFGEEGTRHNANPHPMVEKESQAYQLLAENNVLDIHLYEYAVKLFEEQKTTIDYYENKNNVNANDMASNSSSESAAVVTDSRRLQKLATRARRARRGRRGRA